MHVPHANSENVTRHYQHTAQKRLIKHQMLVGTSFSAIVKSYHIRDRLAIRILSFICKGTKVVHHRTEQGHVVITVCNPFSILLKYHVLTKSNTYLFWSRSCITSSSGQSRIQEVAELILFDIQSHDMSHACLLYTSPSPRDS